MSAGKFPERALPGALLQGLQGSPADRRPPPLERAVAPPDLGPGPMPQNDQSVLHPDQDQGSLRWQVLGQWHPRPRPVERLHALIFQIRLEGSFRRHAPVLETPLRPGQMQNICKTRSAGARVSSLVITPKGVRRPTRQFNVGSSGSPASNRHSSPISPSTFCQRELSWGCSSKSPGISVTTQVFRFSSFSSCPLDHPE